MRIRDSHTPKGRDEPDVQRWSVNDLSMIAEGIGGGNASWADSMGNLFTRSEARPPRKHEPIYRVKLTPATCLICGIAFMGAQPNARYCGDKCRRAGKAKRDALRKAA